MTGVLQGINTDSLGRKNGGKSGKTHVIGEAGRTEWFFSLGTRRLKRDLTSIIHGGLAEELEPDSRQECPAKG